MTLVKEGIFLSGPDKRSVRSYLIDVYPTT
jgi:hypothetical protein